MNGLPDHERLDGSRRALSEYRPIVHAHGTIPDRGVIPNRMSSKRTPETGRSVRIALLAGAVLLLAARPVAATTGTVGMMGGYGGGGFGMIGFGFLWPLLLLGGIAFVVYRAADGGSEGSMGNSSDPALETLRERYARGELTEEQFEQRRRRLNR